jgi:large subunit ribosomal protein L18
MSIRKRLRGNSERPRLSVFRSDKHIYAQIIDDLSGKTLVSASSMSPDLAPLVAGKKKGEKAKIIGIELAKRALAAEITKVAFDRNGFIYHGRVAALAAGAREGGLQF